MALSKKEIQNLSNLFLSEDDNNTKIAFEIMEQQKLPKALLTEIFAVYKLTADDALKATAKRMLKDYGSSNVIAAMGRKLPLANDGTYGGATEKTIAKNIGIYTYCEELDGTKLAMAIYKKYGFGVNYLLGSTPPEKRKEVIKTFINGTVFKLSGKALTKVPPELYDYPDLTEIDLSGNKIKTIPSKIKTFKNLRVLKLQGNNLKKINKAIVQLKNLEELYLGGNLFKEFPEEITQMTWLKQLHITGMCNGTNYYRGAAVPESFKNLTQLEALSMANYTRAVGTKKWYTQYNNYPQVSLVKSHSSESPEKKLLNLEPLAIAQTSYEQNKQAVAYIFQNGDDEMIRPILQDFYDATTKSLDFKETYLKNLPKVVTELQIKHLNLKNSRIGFIGSFYKDEVERNGRENQEVDAERLQYLGDLVDLESLDLSSCSLTNLPTNFNQLRKLKKLDLSHNYLGSFPQSICEMKDLEELNLSWTLSTKKGEMVKIPKELSNLKNLKKLSFYYYNIKEGNLMEEYKNIFENLLPNCEIIIK